MVTLWDTEYADKSKSTYMMYQTKDGVVIRVNLPKDAKPEEVRFSFAGDKVTIECDGLYTKSFSKGSIRTQETRKYPVFSHTIPLNVALDPEGAKVTFRGDVWTLTIPRKMSR